MESKDISELDKEVARIEALNITQFIIDAMSGPPNSLTATITFGGKIYQGVLHLTKDLNEEQEDANDTH